MSVDVIKSILRNWSRGEVAALTDSTAAIVDNDLYTASCLLPSESWASLPRVLEWMQSELPSDCWGSRERRLAWAEKHSK